MSNLTRTVRICVTRTVVETADVVAIVPFDSTDADVLTWAKEGLSVDDDNWDRDDDLTGYPKITVTLAEDTVDYDHADMLLTERGQDLTSALGRGGYAVPWRPPRDCEWIEWRGHRWGCDGLLLWREDAPPSPKLRSWGGGPRAAQRVTPETLDAMLVTYGIDRLDALPVATLLRRSAHLSEWACGDHRRYLDAGMYAGLGPLRMVGNEPLHPLALLDADGDLMALYMPRRVDATDLAGFEVGCG